MNILHLKYAVEVAQTGSINKAASNLFMNQPNLSRAIKELEESLGITIFNRTSRGMSVTDEGEEFLVHARKILAQIDEVEALYSKDKAEKQVFSLSSPRASYISCAFVRFVNSLSKEAPMEISYLETGPMHTIDNVFHGKHKLGILRYSAAFEKHFKKLLDLKDIAYEAVAEFDFVLIMSKNHPLAKGDSVSSQELLPYTELAHSDPFVPSLPFSEVKKEQLSVEKEKKIYVFERASQFEILSSDTDTFMWVSPVPDETLARYGLVQKQCTNLKKHYKDVLIYKKSYHLSPIDNMFIEELYKSHRAYF